MAGNDVTDAQRKEEVNCKIYNLEKENSSAANFLRTAVRESRNGYHLIHELKEHELLRFAQVAIKNQKAGNEALKNKYLPVEQLRDNFSKMTVRSAANQTAKAVEMGVKGLAGIITTVGMKAPDYIVCGVFLVCAAEQLMIGIAAGALSGVGIGAAVVLSAALLYAAFKLFKLASNAVNAVSDSENTTSCDNLELTETSLEKAFEQVRPAAPSASPSAASPSAASPSSSGLGIGAGAGAG